MTFPLSVVPNIDAFSRPHCGFGLEELMSDILGLVTGFSEIIDEIKPL